MTSNFIGVDVGTGSARAGIFDAAGGLLASAKSDIRTWTEAGDIVEQSSRDIWAAVCRVVRESMAQAGIAPEAVAGIGFDATCSLVALGDGGAPMTVSRSGDDDRNIIVWMDHRAIDQASRINALRPAVLDYVGGTISPEMQTPKLLWLKEHLPETFRRAWQFFDLADFLTWKATGSLTRSTCTVTCKWTYLAHERRWDAAYFQAVGLGALAEEGFARIGTVCVPGGTALGTGLTVEAAADLGLNPGTAVAAGLIDAHAGGIGTMGARGGIGDVSSRMAYVFGTSACTMTATRAATFVPGVWGPYFDAMVPGLWLVEGGQSAAGAAMDHLVRLHPAAPDAARDASAAGARLTEWLADRAVAAGGAAALDRLAGGIHVVPEFLGNRAPFADPQARALIAGLDLHADAGSLLGLYAAGLAGLSYGARQILNAQAGAGIVTDTIVVSGGAGQHPLVRQVLADATGRTVSAITCPEPVLLGSAMLGAVAAGTYPTLSAAMAAMSQIGQSYAPDPAMRGWHDRHFAAFETLQAAGRSLNVPLSRP